MKQAIVTTFGITKSIKEINDRVIGWFLPRVVLFMCQMMVSFGVDTGAAVNVMDRRTFDRLKIKPKLSKYDRKLYPYGLEKPLDVHGCFKTRVKYKNEYRSVEFVVINGNHGNLLSYETSAMLGIINRIEQVAKKEHLEVVEKFAKKYPELFADKIGRLKNFEVKLHINTDIKPVQQKLRYVPFHLRDAVEKEIQSMLEQDIIEPVNGPTPWVSPIVVVPKPNKKIRICTDAREANKAIIRERHSSPTIEDLIVALNEAMWISKFDLRSGYHQLLLDRSCRYITAFATHLGIFQYKRLNFGISSASEIFQKVIEQVLTGLPGVKHKR